MKHLFIINPAAGKHDHSAVLADTIRTLGERHGLDYAIRISWKAGDCASAAREAARSGEEYRVYACGGDGTLNEVVSGAVGAPRLSVTHYPCGSGNDFVKNFSDPKAFADLERLLDPEETLLDVIRVGEQDYSLSICSLGIDARIGTSIEHYKRLPLIRGKGAYNLSTVVNLAKGIHRHYVVEVNGEVLDDRFTLICVCNGKFYGGGYEPVPEARPDDGRLEVLLVKKISRLQIARIIGKYKVGRYAEMPEIFTHFTTDRVRIHCDREEVVNLDGEARYRQDVDIRLADQKLRFFYPKGLRLASQ